METQTILIALLAVLAAAVAVLAAAVIVLGGRIARLSNRDVLQKCDDLRREISDGQRALRQELSSQNTGSTVAHCSTGGRRVNHRWSLYGPRPWRRRASR